jgi:hypothetical protein
MGEEPPLELGRWGAVGIPQAWLCYLRRLDALSVPFSSTWKLGVRETPGDTLGLLNPDFARCYTSVRPGVPFCPQNLDQVWHLPGDSTCSGDDSFTVMLQVTPAGLLTSGTPPPWSS